MESEFEEELRAWLEAEGYAVSSIRIEEGRFMHRAIEVKVRMRHKKERRVEIRHVHLSRAP